MPLRLLPKEGDYIRKGIMLMEVVGFTGSGSFRCLDVYRDYDPKDDRVKVLTRAEMEEWEVVKRGS